jgi:hypothetical protein
MAKKKTKVTAEKIASTFGGYSSKAVKAIEKRKRELAKQMKAIGIK